MEDKLRMYGFVPYNISPIQKGIQFGHAVVEYQLKHDGSEYLDWAKNNKTFIILDGGTTNKSQNNLGTLNKHVKTLTEFGIKYAKFYEEDLGDQLSAVVFIVDEKIYNKSKFKEYTFKPSMFDKFLSIFDESIFGKKYLTWLDSLSEEDRKIAEFRKYLSGFKLA